MGITFVNNQSEVCSQTSDIVLLLVESFAIRHPRHASSRLRVSVDSLLSTSHPLHLDLTLTCIYDCHSSVKNTQTLLQPVDYDLFELGRHTVMLMTSDAVTYIIESSLNTHTLLQPVMIYPLLVVTMLIYL